MPTEKAPLAQLFSQISRPELRDLRTFLHSPAHQQREDVRRLFDCIAAAAPVFPLKKEMEKAVLGPADGSADPKRLGYVQGYLQKSVLDWLTWKELSADPARNQLYLVRALRKRGLGRFFEKEWASAMAQTEQRPERHVAHFRRKGQLLLEFNESAKRERRNDAHFYQEMTDAMTTHALAEWLRHGCTLMSHRSVSGLTFDFPLLGLALELLQKEPHWLDEPVVNAYFRVFRSMSGDGSEADFHELKKLLADRWQAFPNDESRDLYLFAINFCIKKSNEGEKRFVREAFELYQSALERRLILENGVLSPYAYNNIMLIALSLGETGWARNFLEEWKANLPEKERENTFQQNLAQFLFRTKNYAEAMDFLQKVEFREPLRFLESRRMLARIYFELEEWAALDSLLDSLRTYLYRKSGLGYHRGSYLNFLKILKKLTAAADRTALKKEVSDIPNLVEREWILEVLNR